MRIKLLLLVIISFLFSHSDHNNNKHNHGKHSHQHGKNSSIYGKIINKDTNDPIEYASVSMYNSKTNKLIIGVISESDGNFQIHDISSGNYFIEISFIGFENKIIKDILMDEQKNLKSIGDISLKPKAIEGTEITVIDDVPVVEFETDKLVYTPSKDILATGGSAEDVLNNVPMVLVDQEGSVTLKGSSNVKILVNGRENRIGEGGNDVDNIPASMIEQVEVITSPSAKYDPEGMAGIINIILKKDKDEGFNGEVKFFTKSNEYHDFGDMGGLSLSTNYKKNKFNFYSSYSNNIIYRDRKGLREAYTTYTTPYISSGLDPNSVVSDSIKFTSLTNTKKRNEVFRIGTDYYLNDKLVVNVEGRYNSYSASEKSSETIILPEEEEKTHEESEPKGNHEYGLSLSLDKTYENPDKELSLFYSYDTHPVDKEYDIIIEDGHRDTTFISNKYRSKEAAIFYSHPINEKSKFETGYEFDQTYNRENMDYYLHVHVDDLEIPNQNEDPHISGVNKYNYKRDIHGAFIEYSTELTNQWSIKPGLRLEYVTKNIQFIGKPDIWYCGPEEAQDTFDSYEACNEACNYTCELTGYPTAELGAYAQMLEENNNIDIDDSYSSVYPSFHITYNITKKRSLQFAISSRVERPGGGHHGGSRQIRPFPREIHSDNFIFLGNPTLKPEYSTNYELSYKSPIPMGFFYTNLYFNSVRDKIEWYSDNSFPSFDVVTFRNADKAKTYGAEWFFMIMGQTLGGGFWYNDVQDGSDDTELNGINQGMNMYGKINLPEKYINFFGLELGFYYMKMKDDYGSMFGKGGTIWANAGISKSLLKKKAQLSLNVNNIFNSGGFSMIRTKPLIEGVDYILSPYRSGEEYTNIESSRNGRTYSITLKYNFGKLQKDKQRFRSGDVERGGGMDMGY